MADLNVANVQQLLVRTGLVSEALVREAWEDTDQSPEGMDLLRALEKKGLITPWQSSKLVKGDETGYFLGGYRLLYKIASGSFGRVFRADEPQTGRMVAVKVLRRRHSEEQHKIDLFMREGQVGQKLKHPNIVEVLGADMDAASQQYFIVMEFVEGGNLREILNIRKTLEPHECLKMMEELAQGLAFAYNQGITHRDIKLTNVLISSKGEAKLVDFGLAQIFEDSAKKGDQTIERTVDYAGLEKLTGVKSGDVRSDIYFLGTCLYQMLCGRSPIAWGKDKHARMNPNRFRDVPPMGRDEVNAPGSTFQLVETMMSLSPQQRYQTPTQLIEAIRNAKRDLDRAEGRVVNKGPKSVFVVEGDIRLQDHIREKLKAKGYRVFIALDPTRARARFRQDPFDALIIDAGTTGEEGMLIFDKIMADAERQGFDTAGILVLSEDQAAWVDRVGDRNNQQLMVRPVTLKQLYRTLDHLLGVEAK